MHASTPTGLANSDLDARRAEYTSKYGASLANKSESGGFIKKRTTNVYAAQQPSGYQTAKNYVMPAASEPVPQNSTRLEGKIVWIHLAECGTVRGVYDKVAHFECE